MIPKIIKDYDFFRANYDVIAYKDYGFLTTYIHCDHDYHNDDFMVAPACKDINTQIVHFYTYVPTYSGLEEYLEKHTETYSYRYIPELLFITINGLIDLNSLPSILNKGYKKHFCFLNSRVTFRRKDLFLYFKESELLDKTYVSFRNITARYSFDAGFTYKNFEENLDKELDLYGSLSWIYPVQDFVFDVSAETYCENTFIGLTEKSLKSFIFGNIPLVYGPSGSATYLKSFGFDLFEDIVDRSYDMENNNDIRFERFKDEIKRLSSIPLSTFDGTHLTDRFKKNREIVRKNYEKALQSLEKIELESIYVSSNRERYLGF